MSQLSFDADLLPRLEALYRTAEILRRRRIVRESLAAAPGERILDVGCGPGFYVADLLEDVGPSGSILGVDRSPQMLGAARRRNEAKANASFLEGEATELPVEEGSFDAALCVQVLEYVPDTVAALAAMRRALRPGGRLLVWDVDWSTLSLHSTDPALTARVLEAWDGHLTHPTLPRTLAAQLRSAGFEQVEAEGHSFSTVEYEPGAFYASMITLMEDYVGGRGDFPPDELRAWSDDLQELGRRGEFFLALTQFCFTAR